MKTEINKLCVIPANQKQKYLHYKSLISNLTSSFCNMRKVKIQDNNKKNKLFPHGW